jgi:hypothetical protein
LTVKVDHVRMEIEPLQHEQKEGLALLYAEAAARPDLGVGTIWAPTSGDRKRPSAIYARGVWSLETAGLDMECVSRTQPRVKQPVQHIMISLNEAESKTVSDEQLIRLAEEAIDRAGFRGHQAVFGVHRDTDNAHCHVAVNSIHCETLRAFDRMYSWRRLHWTLREMEVERGMTFEHGLAEVRQAGMPEQHIAWATKAERLSWAQDRGIAKERLEDLAHSFMADADGVELVEDRRERIVSGLRKMLADCADRKEAPLRADVHAIAARLAATIEEGATGVLRLRMMDRAEPGKVSRETVDSLGDTRQRMARWTPSEIAFDVPLREIVPGDDTFDLAQRAWLADIGDVARSEREVEDILTRDPGRVSRDIVAGGKALFGAEEFDGWTCARLSVDGPEWSDRAMRDDTTLIVRSSDSEHPLFTTKAQLDLETRVSDLAKTLTQERNPLFDRAKLDRAFADVEQEAGFTFTAEQRAALDLLEYRFGTLNGVAGAGKTDLMAVVRRYSELTHQPVIGLATAQMAAEQLAQKSGIDSVNSTRGLVLEAARGQELIAEDAIVIVDEFSMTSCEDAKAVLERVDARSRATVLYSGGGAQLENIAAGNTHRVLTEASDEHGHHRELTDVFRQKGATVAWMRDEMPALDRAILDADAVRVREGFRQFDEHGHVKYHPDRKSEIAGKADDIVAGYERGSRVIAPGVSTLEAKFVNRAVRHKLGHVGQGLLYQLEHRKREFSPGDRIVFTKNAERLYGVLNGYTGDVKAVAPNAITVDLDGGRTIVVDPRKYPHLEWGFAVTTHKSQGQGDPIAVVSITTSDTARTAYVALTRCTEWLHVHTRLQREVTEPEKKQGVLLEHLSSDRALRPKDDALLFEQTVARNGGPDTPWAKAVRRAQNHDADPLRQQHRAEMNERFMARGFAVTELLKKTGEQSARAETLDEPKRGKRLAAIAAGQRRDLDKLDVKFALEPFVSWSVRKRTEIERAAPFIERHAEAEAQRQAQRVAHEDLKKARAEYAQAHPELAPQIAGYSAAQIEEMRGRDARRSTLRPATPNEPEAPTQKRSRGQKR